MGAPKGNCNACKGWYKNSGSKSYLKSKRNPFPNPADFTNSGFSNPFKGKKYTFKKSHRVTPFNRKRV